MDHRDEIVHKLREPLPQLHQDEVQLRQEAAELIEKDGLVLSALPPSPQGPAQTEAGKDARQGYIETLAERKE